MKFVMHDSDAVSPSWAIALQNPLFPVVDQSLRSGMHITCDQMDWFAYLVENFSPLVTFYSRYQAQLYRACEGYFYLLAHQSTIFSRATLSLLEMLIGKILCLMHLSPASLKNEGIWSIQDLLEEISLHLSPAQLFSLYQLRGCKIGGTALDQQKLQERVRLSLWRLKKLGFIVLALNLKKSVTGSHDMNAFRITDAIFRFAADVQEGLSLLEAQKKLIASQQAVFVSLDGLPPKNSLTE